MRIQRKASLPKNGDRKDKANIKKKCKAFIKQQQQFLMEKSALLLKNNHPKNVKTIIKV